MKIYVGLSFEDLANSIASVYPRVIMESLWLNAMLSVAYSYLGPVGLHALMHCQLQQLDVQTEMS